MIDLNKKRRVGAGQAALENTAELKKLKKLKKLKSRGTPRLLSSGLAIPEELPKLLRQIPAGRAIP